MTEWYHAYPYYGNEEAVTYSDYGFALNSAYMWIDEYEPSNSSWTGFGECQLFPALYFSNPNQLQPYSSHDANESSDAYEFVTGSYGPIYIEADGNIDPCAPISTVDNVTYTLTGNIYDSIVLERDNIVLDGSGNTLYGAGIDLSGRKNVTVANTQITGNGISLDGSSDNTVSNNDVTSNGYGYGISLWFSSNNSILGNEVASNWEGIGLIFSSNNSISRNDAENNYYGIRLQYSSSNTLVANVMAGNKYDFSVEGSSLSDFVNDMGASNTVDGKPVYYWVDTTDMPVPSDAGYVALVNCTDITVQLLNLTGALLAYTADSTITQNSIINSDLGINLISSWNDTISGNDLANSSISFYSSSSNTISANDLINGSSIFLSSSSSNSFVGNNVTGDNSDNGFYLGSSNYNSITGNNVTSYYAGFILQESSSNSISGNNIIADNFGIMLNSSSNYNGIIGNNVTVNNGWGIGLFSGSGNTIYHNNFLGYNQTVYSDWGNVWDAGYPSGGNYWSDYQTRYPNASEIDGSGIWNTPYVIDANTTDQYPLMNPYTFVPAHDVAVTDVMSSKNVVGQGYSLNVAVTAADQGDYAETFNVTSYANAIVIGSENVTLPAGNSTTVTLTWTTTGFAYGNYTISAYALLAPGENNTGNNNITGGTVYIGIPGDVDGTGRVDMGDVVSILMAFGSTLGQPNYNPNCDIENTGRVDMGDVVIALRNFGQHYP